jgi:two-component system response regulator
MTGQKILLVEDNEDHVILTMQALKDNNIANEVVVAHDGQEAVDYLFGTEACPGRDTGDLPVLVLLDLNLPFLNGLEVLQRIRRDERTRLLPVVILTSSSQDDDIVGGYGIGANSYVLKPVRFADLSQAMRQIGMYWLLLNVAPPARRS